MYSEIKACRICGNTELISILNLGNQAMTGVFPKTKEETISSGPLELLKCFGSEEHACGLVQLKQTYDLREMYGFNYGYRSGLNQSMVRHLQGKVQNILNLVTLEKSDLVVDIGSNDSTLLQSYPTKGHVLVGIDPTGKKFKDYYPPHIKLIPEFFSAEIVKERFGNKKAKIVTSIAMFYDLEAPMEFMQAVYDILNDEGVWVVEQSYMPSMLEVNAYDAVCHEHLEYYALRQFKWMADRVGFKIIDVEFNDTNGGSFSLTLSKSTSRFKEKSDLIQRTLKNEAAQGLSERKPYQAFKEHVYRHRDELVAFIRRLKAESNIIFGYGASTKGNVMLQFCNLTEKEIPFIAEVNKDKFGCYTPGTRIPIISEQEAKAMRPDYLMVLPWHFKHGIIKRESEYLAGGGRLFFPLPTFQIVQAPVGELKRDVTAISADLQPALP